jgi:hypothetical protein
MGRVITSSEAPARVASLEADGPSALRNLRRVLSVLLESIGPIGRAVELAALLKLDSSLAWKVWRVAQGPDELPSPKHIPGRAAMTTFLSAAELHGAPKAKISAVRKAHTHLEGVFKEHAGDRASAEILLGQFTDEGRSRLEMQLRREAFRANSHFLGVRMRTRHNLDLIAPSPKGFMPQQARIRGYYDLQRTRADARWVLSRSFIIRDGKPEKYKRTPFAGASGPGDPSNSVPIAPGFCSPADLPLQRTRVEHSFIDELGPSPVGVAGAANIVTAETISELPYQNVPHDTLGVTVRTPSERLCYELYIHRDILRDTQPKLEAFTSLNGMGPDGVPNPRDRVPILESLRALGGADRAAPAVEVPRHSELTAWMFECLGHSPKDFVAYRMVMRFPPIPILIWVTYQLPQA